MRNTKTTKKPLFIVDLTNCKTYDDVRFEIICEKARSGVKITDSDIQFIMKQGAFAAIELIEENVKLIKPIYMAETDKKTAEKIVNILEEKKKPWYKRLWNRLKYAFTW
jgi:hypothetical protein